MKDFLLRRVMNWLIGGGLFASIQDIVSDLANEDIPGEEKRATAKRRILALASGAKGFLINLAIEAAVYLTIQKSVNK